MRPGLPARSETLRTLLLALSLSGAALGQEPGGDVAAAIAELGGSDYETRQRAAERLEGIGAPALPALEEAGRSEDPEIRRRALEVLRAIRLRLADRAGIWPALVAGSPWREPDGGAAVDFELDGAGMPRARRDGEAIPLALDGTTVRAGERAYALDAFTGALFDQGTLARRLEARGAQPIDDFVGTDPRIRREFLWQSMRHPLGEPEIGLSFLDDVDPEVRAMAACHAGVRHLAAGRDRLRRLLFDEDPRVRREAAVALGRLGFPDDAGRLERLLEDPDEGVRAHAREALEGMR